MAYEDAAALYQEWHQFEPEGIIDIDIPEPRGDLTYCGLLKRLDYMSPKWEREEVYYYHHFRQGWPQLYIDGKGNYYIYGNIRITKDGIDDWLKPQVFGWKKPKARKGVSKLGVLQLLSWEDAKTGKTKSQMFGDRYYVGNPSKDFTYISTPMRQNPSSKPIAVLQLENIVDGIRRDKKAMRVLERAFANRPRGNPITVPVSIAAKAAEAAAATAASQAFLKSIVTGVSTATFGVGMVATVLGSLLVNFVVGYIKNKVTPPTMPPPPKWVAKMTQSYMDAGVEDPKDITDRVQEIWNEQSFESKVGTYEGESGKEGEEGEDEPDVEEPDVSGETEGATENPGKVYTKEELQQKALEMTQKWAYEGKIKLASDAWTFFRKKGIDLDFSAVRKAFAEGKRKRHKDDQEKRKGAPSVPYIANPQQQVKCPKCGGEGWLDISGKYVCRKCGNLFSAERDLYSSRFNPQSNPIRSKAQYRFFKARHPDIFEDWQRKFPVNYGDLPEKVEANPSEPCPPPPRKITELDEIMTAFGWTCRGDFVPPHHGPWNWRSYEQDFPLRNDPNVEGKWTFTIFYQIRPETTAIIINRVRDDETDRRIYGTLVRTLKERLADADTIKERDGGESVYIYRTAKGNPLAYEDFKEAAAGEGWAINDYAGMIAEADTDKERKVLTHIRKEEEEHLDELVGLMECKKRPKPNPAETVLDRTRRDGK